MLDLETASYILVAAPSIGPAETETCTHLLLSGEVPKVNILHIDFIRSPSERQDYWMDKSSNQLDELAVLNVETQTRSSQRSSSTKQEQSMIVETVSAPGNLTQLGMGITKCLNRWNECKEEIRVCLHSVSAMLHYMDLSSVFQFLNVLRSQITQREATGHVHIDPNAHEEMVIDRLKPLFDAHIQVSLDGPVDVTSR